MEKLCIKGVTSDEGEYGEVRACPKHGPYWSRKTSFAGFGVWAPCPECMEEVGRTNVIEQDMLRRKARAEAVMTDAQIPQRFASRSLENYTANLPGQVNALRIATEYAGQFEDCLASGRSLIFCGTAGTGKTHLALGIAKRVIATGRSAAFTSAMDAIRRVRETYRKNADKTERQVIEEFSRPDLTIIDEVGSQLGTDAEKVTLFDLINARYERERPMIVMSNLTIAEVEQYMGARAFDRLRENGGQAVTFTWRSYRRGK